MIQHEPPLSIFTLVTSTPWSLPSKSPRSISSSLSGFCLVSLHSLFLAGFSPSCFSFLNSAHSTSLGQFSFPLRVQVNASKTEMLFLTTLPKIASSQLLPKSLIWFLVVCLFFFMALTTMYNYLTHLPVCFEFFFPSRILNP